MEIQSKQNVCTSTCFNKLKSNLCCEDDEMYTYIEITELLIAAQSKSQIAIGSIGSVDENVTLPMRKSLFAHVPPFIIFQNKGTTTTLPPEITNHLLWWRAKSYFPQIISSTVTKSGFKTTIKPTSNWCGTWCNSKLGSSQLKNTKVFSKINNFPSNVHFGDKILLWKNFQRMQRRYGSKYFDFMPLTFVLPEERDDLERYMQKNRGIWIVKPPDSCAGSGIKIVSRSYEIPNYHSLIAQRYISKPQLINGIKFDIRLYVLLTSVDPLRIYVYNNGLVRLATVKYVNHVSTLSNRFMHLTNTSVNKSSPNFKINDNPNKCKGNMWSLSCLWKYLTSIGNVDPCMIWSKIKDIAIKTVVSAEPFIVKAWKKNALSTYNHYQLFGFDILLDKKYQPWLLEVNVFPSMESDTPLCKIIKGQLARDYLNLVGFHVPNVLTVKELDILKKSYKETTICYNQQVYSSVLTWTDKRKQHTFCKISDRKSYLKSILKCLTPGDVRILIRHEDEITQTGRFETIFPTCDTHKYFQLFNEVRYYNLLLDAWENEYAGNRLRGIERLRKLCKKKYHLS
ncbi:tubulin monoglutamylase TTLL4 [Ptiloglossa arizonensis]|uniref:tubulin monoglutamylase TTLL4 n=1 Tax=Ptiloglossa arizonensis TaxID=3350558 RepID=UPI003FA0753E